MDQGTGPGSGRHPTRDPFRRCACLQHHSTVLRTQYEYAYSLLERGVPVSLSSSETPLGRSQVARGCSMQAFASRPRPRLAARRDTLPPRTREFPEPTRMVGNARVNDRVTCAVSLLPVVSPTAQAVILCLVQREGARGH